MAVTKDELYVGQDWARTIPLRVDGIPYVGMSGATVTAQLVKKTSDTAYTTNGAAQSCADSGNSNYAAGIVEVIYADTVTTGLTGGTWILEIKSVESGGDIRIFHITTPILVIPTGQG